VLRIALLAVAHGSSSREHIETIRKIVELLVDNVRKSIPDIELVAYELAFMGKRRGLKSVSEALRELSKMCDTVLILPLFLTPGKHVRYDLPREFEVGLDECEPNSKITVNVDGKTITLLYAAPIGFDGRLIEILLDRIRDVLEKAKKS